MKYHNFEESLAYSHKAEDLPFWKEIYQKAFPTMAAMINHREDGDHQRNGIDRSIILHNSKQILIDEKVRKENYGDIALEYLSDENRQIPGWVQKPLLCDYIAYCIVPAGKCYLLPTLQLQQAWIKNKEKWMKNFEVRAENKNGNYFWTTVSYAVNIAELYKSIGSFLRIDFNKDLIL